MPESVTTCLLNAITKVQASKVLSGPEQQQIIAGLKDEISGLSGSAERKVARALIKHREASREVFMQTVGRARLEAKLVQFDSLVAERGAAAARDFRNSAVKIGDEAADSPSAEALMNVHRAEAYAEVLPAIQLSYDLSIPKGINYVPTPEGNEIRLVLNGGTTTNPAVQAAAGAVRAWMNRVAKEARGHGRFIQKLEDYWPLRHSFEKIQAARAEWEQFLRDRLDPDEFPDPQEYIDTLYENLAGKTGLESSTSGFGLPRITKFKSPDDLNLYMERFGPGSFGDELRDMIELFSRELSILEKWGPMAKVYTEEAAKKLEKRISVEQAAALKTGDAAALKAIDGYKDDFRGAKEGVSAFLDPIQDPANIASDAWVRAATNASRGLVLGATVGYDLTIDPATIFFNTRLRTGSYTRALNDFAASYRDALPLVMGKNGGAILEDMGVQSIALPATAMDNIMSGNLAGTVNLQTGAVGSRGRSEALARKVGQAGASFGLWTQRMSGATTVVRANGAVSSLTVSRIMARNSRSMNWADLHGPYRTILEGSGVTEGLWRQIQKLPVAANGGLDFSGMPLAKSRHIRAALMQDAGNLRNRPGMWERIRLGGYQPSTGFLSSVGKAAYSTFMSWPLAFVQRSVARQVRLGGFHSIGFAAGLTAAAVVQMQLRAAVTGREAYAWDNPELWTRGLISSGLFGPYGETAFAQVDPFGGYRSLGDLLPASLVGKFAGNFADMAVAIYEGDTDEALFRGLKTAATPIPNLWYLDAVKNRVISAAAAELSPEHARHYERLARERATGVFSEP